MHVMHNYVVSINTGTMSAKLNDLLEQINRINISYVISDVCMLSHTNTSKQPRYCKNIQIK